MNASVRRRTLFLLATTFSMPVMAEDIFRGPLRAADAEQMRIIVEGDASSQEEFMHQMGIVKGSGIVHPTATSELGARHGDVKLSRRYTKVFLFECGKWRFLARQATIAR